MNSLRGDAGNDTFFGTAGNDTLNGGSGTDDTANYTSFTTAVTLSAQGVLNKGANLGVDTLIGIERIIGSATSLSDTIDLSGAIAPATNTLTNLTTGSVAINGSSGVLLINGSPLSFAVSQFENVSGSNLPDSITGNSLANNLSGAGGNDTFFGTAGNDTLNGGSGTDDTANYTSFTTAVTLSAQGVLRKATNLGVDTLIGIERIIGSATSLSDTIDLSGAIAPATNTLTNLTTGSVAINGSNGVLIINGSPLSFAVSQFENVSGSNLPDSITGNSLANNLNGAGGNDTLNGGLGNDTLNGGDGIDTASYADAPGSVNVSLTSGLATGAAGVDTLLNIENVTAGGFNDTLTGNSLANNLSGGAGNDFISGEGGSDVITGNSGKDTMLGGADTAVDTFVFNTLGDSLLAFFDVIGDFTSIDILDRPGALPATLNSSNGIALGLSGLQVGSILNPFSFTANSSRAFTAIGFSGTFIAFNDNIAGFNEFSDSIIHLPSFNISPTNTISIA